MPRPPFNSWKPSPNDVAERFDDSDEGETDIEYSNVAPRRARAPRTLRTRALKQETGTGDWYEDDAAPKLVSSRFADASSAEDSGDFARNSARRPSRLRADARNRESSNNASAPAASAPNALAQNASTREDSLRDAARRASSGSSRRDSSANSVEARSAEARSAEARASSSTRFDNASDTSSTRRSRDRSRTSNRSANRRVAQRPAPQTPRALWYEIGGVLLLAVGALLLWNTRLPTEQIHGKIPQLFIGVLRALFGIGAVVLPLLGCVLGATLISRHHHTNLRAFGRGAAVAFVVLLTGSHLLVRRGREFLEPEMTSHGGFLGAALSRLLRFAVGNGGAIIFLFALSLVAVLLWSELSLAQTFSRTRNALRNVGFALRSRLKMRREREYDDDYDDEIEQVEGDWRDPKETATAPIRSISRRALRSPDANIEYSKGDEATRTSPFLPVDELLQDDVSAPTFSRALSTLQDAPAETKPVELAPKIEFTDAPPPVSVLETPLEPIASATNPVLDSVGISPEIKSEDEMTPTEKLEAQALATATEGEAPIRRPRVEKPRRRFGDGPLMPEYFDDAVRALDPPVVPDLEGAEDDIHQGVKAVTETLASFKIDARVTDVKRGPVITRYEVQPAPGVRVATIAALDRDMSRALSAIAVRIEAPVPGKDVIGIEVPNKKVNLVRLRDVLERHDFLSTQSKLSFVLGKDIAGQPKWADLTKMPHMLVAGATNSGKSVCLNSIIASILVRATPEEVKFSLIDPKRVELTLFNGIKHLYHPVVVEPKDAVKVLRGMIAEMDRRYKRFAERGVRNIVSYNSKLEPDEAPLPYIVIVIDELADLMMTAAAEFEKLICRLAQLARATGIHLIVATQRPSVNVITGVIKANIPSRIAFAVASQVDSRTILDSMGAERLIGSGDMLFDANNGGKAIRIQGAFLSEEEVNRVVDVVKAAYADDETPIEYGMDISAVTEDDVNEANEKTVARSEKKDELYDEILEYVVRNTEMSASMIQRKFEIGYPRAARIVDQFERDGVLSPANGSKPRKVIGNGRGVEMN